jgi:hypothetical protein
MERHLLRSGAPRLQLTVLVLMTGLIGLFTSACLLHLGMETMTPRYVISVAVAYGSFLVLVWLWITCQQRRRNRVAKKSRSKRISGATTEQEPFVESRVTTPKPLPRWVEELNIDESIVVLLIGVGAVSIFFVIWQLASAIVYAPEFLAEIFLDGVFSAALYSRLSRIEHRHWLKSAFARTKAPFFWTLVFFVFVGSVSRYYAPEAISIGGLVRHLTLSR